MHSLTWPHSSHIIVLVSSPTKMRSMKFIRTPSFPYAVARTHNIQLAKYIMSNELGH